MKRRNYIATVGASAIIPFGFGGILQEVQDDHLTPKQFRQRIPEQIGRYEGEIAHEGDTDTAGQILIAIYQDTKWPVGIQYIEQNDPQIIVMMHGTHYYATSLSDAVTRLSRFFEMVDVQHSNLRDAELEYITYKFADGYQIRAEYDLRDNEKESRAWVNGELHAFETQIKRNKFVNEKVQSQFEE